MTSSQHVYEVRPRFAGSFLIAGWEMVRPECPTHEKPTISCTNILFCPSYWDWLDSYRNRNFGTGFLCD